MLRRLLPDKPRRRDVDTSLAIVNIVLLLIFFFLITGALSNSSSFGVDIARTRELPIEILPQPILVIGADQTLELNGEPIERADLSAALVNDLVVHVLLDRDAFVSDLLALLEDEALTATEVRLVTLHSSASDLEP